MSAVPTSVEALQDALATSRPAPVRLAGAGTKASPDSDTPRIDLSALRGIAGYNPAECVITALAGTPVADLEATLAVHHQYLPFDPTHVRAGRTIGGTVASGLSGSGRYRYGGVRDFIIGARVVDGHGRLIASGGQVVKNAAGFLTHHALVGSAGRLGAIAEVTFKVFPRPEARATLRARCPSLADALAAHERLRATAMDLEALDLATEPDGGVAVWVRLAGATTALPARVARAQSVLACATDTLAGDDDARVWTDAAEFSWASGATAVIKVPTAPSRVLAVVDTLAPLGTCRVQCGGAVTLLATRQPVDLVHVALAGRGWRGVVVQGAAHGRLLGAAAPPAFADRVRLALDPDHRFE
jgi:glycolate oxidase FAD binding subunit